MEKTKVTKAVEKTLEANEETKNIEEYRLEAESCEIIKLIPFGETLDFVNGVVRMCFDDSDEYTPEILDFAMKYYTLVYYTNMKMPTDIESVYELVYLTDIMDFVTSRICTKQYDVLFDAVKEKINSRIADIRYSAQRELDRIKDGIEGFVEEMKTMFDGVSHEDMEGLVKAISSSGALDEEKIVKAVLANRDK